MGSADIFTVKYFLANSGKFPKDNTLFKAYYPPQPLISAKLLKGLRLAVNIKPLAQLIKYHSICTASCDVKVSMHA